MDLHLDFGPILPSLPPCGTTKNQHYNQKCVIFSNMC